jgi:hypothetical protein
MTTHLLVIVRKSREPKMFGKQAAASGPLELNGIVFRYANFEKSIMAHTRAKAPTQ